MSELTQDPVDVANSDDLQEELPQYEQLTTPREGLPELITTKEQLVLAANQLAAGHGPVALDAERASGFRYSQRAYLVQLRRAGSGSFLIDPIEFSDLNIIQDAIESADWILHAASQDLVCLAELGLRPIRQLFDTELAGRLLGYPRVGLGTMLETQLGFSLAKEHSAADWSTRPLPESWLNYAALDVELLIELWEVIAQQLHERGRYDWALQEFDHVRETTAPIVRQDPWRRTSGIHKIRKPRNLGIVRELWLARDAVAQRRDTAPGRILPDRVIATIAEMPLSSVDHYLAQSSFKSRGAQRFLPQWRKALENALQMPESDLPGPAARTDGPPQIRNWSQKFPESYAVLEHVRAAISELAEEIGMPPENLITPDTMRRLLWQPAYERAELRTEMQARHVRPWQIELVAPIIDAALFGEAN